MTPKNAFRDLAGLLPAMIAALLLFGLADAPRVSAQTLKIRFPFNDSGTVTTDSVAGVVLTLSSNSAPLNFHGPANSGPGSFGGSLNFPGTYGVNNGAIAQSLGGNGVNLGNVTNFTISFWLKPTATLLTGNFERFFIIATNGTTDLQLANSIGMCNNGDRANGGLTNSTEATVGTQAPGNLTSNPGGYGVAPILVNSWTFLALTYDNTNLTYYVGNETNSAQLISTASTGLGGQTIRLGSNWNLFLGNRAASSGNRAFKGYMADVRFYTGAGDSNFVELARETAWPPGAATNLAATSCGGQALLTWSPVPLATGYIVKRSASMGVETNYDTTSGTNYTDIGVTSGTKYFYEVVATNVAGAGASSGEISVMAVGSGFTWATQPISQTVCQGSTATFSASTTGGSGLTYQWQSSINAGTTWSNLAGANATSYTTAPLLASANGTEYQMVVSNTCGSTATTTAATLTVNAFPVVWQQPASQTIVSNWTAVFTVQASAAQTYQWQQNGTNLVNGANISGSTNPVLTLANVPLAYSGYTYACIVGNNCNTTTSTPPATLTVNSSVSSNLLLQFGFEDSGMTTTDSVSGVSLNLVDSFGSPVDLHGAPGSGVLGQGQALSLLGGAQGGTGPMAFTTNNSQANFGTISSFTVTMWINPNTANLNGSGIFSRYFTIGTNGIGDSSYNNANAIGLINDANYYPGGLTSLTTYINASQPPTTSWGAYPLTANQWTFLAVTYDGANIKLYGGAQAVAATLASADTNFLQVPVNGVGPFNLFLGNRLAQDRAFSGLMDDVRFYRGAAPASVVEAIRQAAVNVPFSIATNPVSQSVCEGSTATFSVATSGGSGLTYQWQESYDGGQSWNPISGATGTNYTTGTLSTSDNGEEYDVVVSSAFASLPSSPATLTVSAIPTIVVQPSSQTIASNWTAIFEAQVTGSALYYQWQQNGTNLVDGASVSGSTNTVLTLANVPPAFSGSTFACVVGSACGPISSPPAILTVSANPATNMLVQFQFKDSGATTTDSVAGVTLSLVDANGNPTDLHGGPGSGVAGLGQALNFNQPGSVQGGLGPLASVTGNSQVNFGTLDTFTITMWLNPASPLNLGSFGRFLILGANGINDGTVTNTLELLSNSSRLGGTVTSVEEVVNTLQDNVTTFGAVPIPTNQWTFLAASYDGQTLRFYGCSQYGPVSLQCQQSFQAGNVNIGSAFSLFLGNRATQDRCFAGLMDDVRVYPGAVVSAGDLESIRLAASPTPPPPVASFTALPGSGVRPLNVTFADLSSGVITNLLWSFGDGTTTNTPASNVLTHVYLVASNSYSAILTASGPGGSSTATNSITVTMPNPAQIMSLATGVGSLTIQGANGPASASQTYYYELLTSTNLAFARSNWTVVATNAFNPDGSFSNTIPLAPGDLQRFYLLQLP